MVRLHEGEKGNVDDDLLQVVGIDSSVMLILHPEGLAKYRNKVRELCKLLKAYRPSGRFLSDLGEEGSTSSGKVKAADVLSNYLELFSKEGWLIRLVDAIYMCTGIRFTYEKSGSSIM